MLHRLDKRHVLVLHEKGNDITALAASETLESAGLGEDIKRRCLLLVEGTAPDEPCTALSLATRIAR